MGQKLTINISISQQLRPIFLNRHVFKRRLHKKYYSTTQRETRVKKAIENDYAHSVMERRGYFNRMILDQTRKYNFKEPILMNELKRKLPKLSDDEIENLCLMLSEKSKSSNLNSEKESLVFHLSLECVRRMQNWDVRRSLTIGDCFYRLKCEGVKVYSYNNAMVKRLLRCVPRMTCRELISLMFFINLQRSCDANVMRMLEDKLLQCLPHLTTEEIAVAAMAFFKTQTTVESKVLQQAISERFLKDVDRLPDLAIAVFGKLFRYEARAAMNDTFLRILDRCVPLIQNWSLAAALHIGLISSTAMLEHKLYIETMARKLYSNLSTLRLKDLTNLLNCVSYMNYEFENMPDFYSDVINEFRTEKRQEEVMLYPNCLISSLVYLAYQKIFPEDLIRKSLDPSFISLYKDKANLQNMREYFVLDCTIQLEVPHYTGPKLPLSLKRTLWKMTKGKVPQRSESNLSFNDKYLLTIQNDFSKLLGGSKYATIAHVLPHFRLPDVILHLDDNGYPLATNGFKSSEQMQPALEKGKCICILIGGRNCYSSNSTRRIALVNMKERHLRLLGYEVIEIPFYDYYAIVQSKRLLYLENLIRNLM